ncbi:MAG: hypothetical protein NT115_20105, partial [Proteobacteria bacterium]|nr:hypothetical protein [Pseudomonadota bacterium]
TAAVIRRRQLGHCLLLLGTAAAALSALLMFPECMTNVRHSRESGNPGTFSERRWIPAVAGMTVSDETIVMKYETLNR